MAKLPVLRCAHSNVSVENINVQNTSSHLHLIFSIILLEGNTKLSCTIAARQQNEEEIIPFILLVAGEIISLTCSFSLPQYSLLGYFLWSSFHCTTKRSTNKYKIFPARMKVSYRALTIKFCMLYSARPVPVNDMVCTLQKLSTKMIYQRIPKTIHTARSTCAISERH